MLHSCNKQFTLLRRFLAGTIFLLYVVGGILAESSTCDESYSDNGKACAFYNFGCGRYWALSPTLSTTAIQIIPTCFNGLAQSPIDLDFSSATVKDPGQVNFSGYDDCLDQTPFLRLTEFTVQLDFNQQMKRQRQRKRLLRKSRRKKKNSLKRSNRDANLPSISGGALGDNT